MPTSPDDPPVGSATPPDTSGGVDTFPARYAKTRRFTIGVPRNLTVLDDRRVLFLRSRDGHDPELCLWILNPGGDERVLVDPAQLDGDHADLPAAERARRERARESAGGVVGYAVDRAGRRACFVLAGTLHVVDLATGEVSTPPAKGPAFDPRLSPDGTRVAYVSGNDLRMVELDRPDGSDDGGSGDGAAGRGAAGDDRALATAGSPSVNWGRAEFIAAEEMERSRGFWWSPDSRHLLATRVDESRVGTWWIADPAHPDRQPTEIRYPAAGTANAVVELHLIDLDSGDAEAAQAPRRQIPWDEDGRFEYLANVLWSRGFDPIVVRQTRDQRQVSMAAIDQTTLALTERRMVTDDVWVELIPSSPTPCERGLLTIEDLSPAVSDPDPAGPGRRALLLDGKPITGPDLNVRSIVGVLDRWAVVSAWTSPTEIDILAVDLASSPEGTEALALTSGGAVNAAVIGGGRARSPVSGSADTRSDGSGADPAQARSDHTAPVIVVTTTRPESKGVEVRVRALDLAIESGEAIESGYGGEAGQATAVGDQEASIADLSLGSPIIALPTFCQLGPDRLESALFLPSGYDGSSKLPVLLDPYGGPHAQRVLKQHTPHLVSQWFAEQGFAVLVTDGRGTPGRGPTWERQVWGDLAEPVLTDQLEALDAAVDEYDILDLDRVAVRGWSFGGYLAALAVLRRPDRFHAAIAGAPVTSWRLYDTHYTERYLGRPDLQPMHYERSDLLAEADQLVRPLLLIHGLADDNVVAAHTLQLSAALLAAGAPHRVLPLSGVTHMTPQEVVAENLLWFQLDFLRQALGQRDGAGPPQPKGRPRP